MSNLKRYCKSIEPVQFLTAIFIVEYLIMMASGLYLGNLYSNPFFVLQVDPIQWIFYLVQWPQTLVSNYWFGMLFNLLLLVGLILFYFNPKRNLLAFVLLIGFLGYYVTITGYLAHRNFHTGMFLFFFPFVFAKNEHRYFAYEGLRYYLLFFYLSAALLKMSSGAILDQNLLSNMLPGQFGVYYMEADFGLRTQFNLFLIRHPMVSYSFYLAAFAIEFSVIIGFFTKRFDKILLGVLLFFHFANWIVMDIAPIGHLAFLGLLGISKHVVYHLDLQK